MGGYTMEPMVNPTSLMETAATIAVGAAELITRQRAEIVSLDEVTTTKSSDVDPVTIVDKSAEDYIADQLAQLRPEDGLLGEEGGNRSSKSGVTWIVDPIDGTMNFVMQHANFYIMIALYVDGKPTLGYIMDVIDGTVYHGGKKRGVFENNRRLTSPANNGLKDSLVALNSAMILACVRWPTNPGAYGCTGRLGWN